MSKVKIQGNASGTGVLTITAPNTSTDRTITLPDTTGTLLDENSSLPAANLTGTVADARFPATLPAASAANLTAIPAANITGTLPAISGANLTGLSMDNTPYWSGKDGSQDYISRRVWTDLACTQTTDSDNAFNGTTFTVPSNKAGKYFVFCTLTGNDDQQQMEDLRMKLLVGSSDFANVQNQWTGNPSYAYFLRSVLSITAIVDLSVGDVVKFQGYIADSADNGDRHFRDINMGGFKIG